MKLLQHKLPVSVIALTLMVSQLLMGQNVFINEIMADNQNTLLDENGDASDWIELYNDSATTVNLEGWHLTDDAGDLTKWDFPATNIPSKNYLIVFASNKDRSTAGAELHTNFKLSAAGEYLALVQASGNNIEHALTFPQQEEDVSYGHGFSTSSNADPITLLDSSASATAHIPTSASDSTGWQAANFDDSSWLTGTTGVGYENSSGYDSLIGLDVLAMRNVNQSVYIRVPFSVDDASSLGSLTLKMKYDDGFAAYLNGSLVASQNVSGTLAWNSGGNNHSDGAAALFEEFDISSHAGSLNEGVNVLAIHGLNGSLSSSDLIFMPKIEATLLDGGIEVSALGLLSSPTPGSINASVTYAGNVDTPIATPSRGFFNAPFSVTLSNPTEAATIRYTTDGSDPTENSPEYTGPITISTTTCLRTGAFIEGWKPSASRTDTYIFVDDVATQPKSATTINGQVLEYGMDAGVQSTTYYDSANQLVTIQDALTAIPSISITTDDAHLYGVSTGIYVNASQRWEVPASAELINPDGTEGFQINAGLRIRGGASRTNSNPKHSFRLVFKNQYGEGKLKFALFENEGVDEYDKIDFRSAQNYSWSKDNSPQNTFLRDVFARDTSAAMEQAYSRSRYYHLYLNGRYWGLFMTEERPVAGFGASHFGGDKDDYDAIKAAPSRAIEITDGNTDAYERLYNAAMAGFTDNADYFSIQGLDANGEPEASNEKLLDVDNMIDYLLVLHYMAASDNCITWFSGNPGHFEKLNNMYAIYNRVNPDGFKWIHHDSEHSLDKNRELDVTGPFLHENFTLLKYFNAMTLHDKLTVNEEYRVKFSDRVYKHLENGGVLVRENSEARLDFRAAQIDRAIVANAARWGSTSRDRNTWVDAVATTRAWLARSGDRCTEVIGYLDADGLIPSIFPPLLDQTAGLVESGTTVSLSAAEGTIYYTIDGTDPRAVGGAVAGSIYSNAIAITRPTHIKARALSLSNEWSALAEETYWTPEIPLAVTELMYHSPEGNPYDFIEIRNISNETVSLNGYKLDNAIDFKFKTAAQSTLDPGEYLVVIDDIDAFNTAYPSSSSSDVIAGEYSGDFSNNGEQVDLEFRNNDLVSFNYDDARNWPQAADGVGHSLVPLDSAIDKQESGSLDYGENWRASTYQGGSPGTADPVLGASVVLNEIWAHTDTDLDPPYDSNDKIELYNTSDSTVTISDWHLSDSLNSPRKWLIPDTTLSAGSFIVFDESDFHSSQVDGFGLNKAGEQVVLAAPDRIVDIVRFKGQENSETGVSWGRYPDGAGDWITTAPTHAAPNQPVTPTVRISELMYHPAQDGNDYEYILIENVGTTSHTFENEVGTYRIDGGVQYTFPTGTTLAAGERLWILSFNPIDTTRLDLFSSAYGLDTANETFLGGYNGSLSDRAERVALERPQDSDDPLNPLNTSWVILDEVFYFDQSPWPRGADGTGYPLLRTGISSWGAPSASDADADQISDQWELLHFDQGVAPEGDPDGDGQTNLQEFIGGTIPTDMSDYFMVQDFTAPTLTWDAIDDRTYSIYRTTSLNEPFIKIATVTNSPFSDTSIHSEQPTYFYRITVELNEQ
jgi:hypothetical protein